MKTNKKLALCFALLLLTAGTVLSCGETAKDPEDTKKNDTAAVSGTEAVTEPAEKSNGRSDAADSLPDDLDFGEAKIRLLARKDGTTTEREFYNGGESGDIMEDVIYKRNRAVEERLNVRIENKWSEVVDRHTLNDVVRLSVTADSDEYDLITDALYGMSVSSFKGYLQDLSALPYLDFKQPWWNQAFMETTRFTDRNYMALGELATTMIGSAFVTFFNKSVYAELYADEPTLYETVEAGKWTLDKMIDYCKDVYRDLNGSNIPDLGDRFGNYYRGDITIATDGFLGGCKAELIKIDAEGNVLFNSTPDRTAKIFEKLIELDYGGTNSCHWATEGGDENGDLSQLASGNLLFVACMLDNIESLRDMKNDFGIIPMPKLDEEQEDYTTYAQDSTTTFALPVTTPNGEMTAAFLEAMCAESYRTVTPVYFETVLKTKYSRDEQSSRMLDIITDSVYLDLSYIYGSTLQTTGNLRFIMQTQESSGKWASTLASYENAFIKGMNRIIESYEKIE